MMNISNSLTVGRIVLIFLALILANIHPEYPGIYPVLSIEPIIVQRCHEFALILVMIAGFTDFLDGYLARKLNQVTDFGKLMDPLADKIFVTAVFLILVEADNVTMPAWIPVVIISREFMVTGLRTLAASKGVVIPADGWGKVKTALQMALLLIGGMVWVGWLPIDLANPTREPSVIIIIWHLCLWAIVLLTVCSGIGYFWRYRAVYNKDW